MNRCLRALAAMLLMCMAAGAAQAEAVLVETQVPLSEDGFYEAMPEHLRFIQHTEEEEVARDIFIRRTYPDTVNDRIDAEMRALIDSMTEANRAALPLERSEMESWLDVGAVVTRTGTSVLSFLTLAEVSREHERTSVDMQARVYDAATGRQLALDDFFAPESGVYELLAGEIRAQLTAAFPGTQHDEAALERLCSEEGIRSAAFTLSAGRLTLSYRADALYPGKQTLLHVHMYYPQIRGMMNEYGLAQTDNSRFRMVALTYDDGGARNYTRRVLDQLRCYGAGATFFVVGRRIRNNHDILSRQQDSAYSIQSHTYTHKYAEELNRQMAFEEKAMFEEELVSVTGMPPTMMRAPGGRENFYIRREIGYPLMHWSLASGDSGSDNAAKVASRVIHSVTDGDVILLHDINGRCHIYTQDILENLCARGILCVTIEELFSDAGVALEDHVVYFSPYRTGGIRE